MTSNIGARYITDRKNLGFGSGEKREYDESKNEIIKELKKEFRPELINRIDEIIVFHKLENREIIDIAKIMLKQIEKRLEEKKIILCGHTKVYFIRSILLDSAVRHLRMTAKRKAEY